MSDTQIDYEILNLMRFYQVDTEHQLIKAQALHIERLQKSVANSVMNTKFGITNVPRIG